MFVLKSTTEDATHRVRTRFALDEAGLCHLCLLYRSSADVWILVRGIIYGTGITIFEGLAGFILSKHSWGLS
jgi:hypothetical protein